MIPPVGPALPAYPLMESPKVMVSSDPRPVTTIGVRGAGSAVSVGFASLPPKGSSQVKSVNVLGTEQDQT